MLFVCGKIKIQKNIQLHKFNMLHSWGISEHYRTDVKPFHTSTRPNFRVCGWNPKVWLFQMKAIEQYFPVALFSMLYRVALTFESVDKIVKCVPAYMKSWQFKPTHYGQPRMNPGMNWNSVC